MPIIAGNGAVLGRLGNARAGTLIDCHMGRCLIVGSQDRLGIINLTRGTFLEYFPLTPREADVSIVTYTQVELAIDTLVGARITAQIPNVTDYSNMIAVDAEGLSLVVRNPVRGGFDPYVTRRISATNWSLLPEDRHWGELQIISDWRLLVRFSAGEDWQVLKELRPPQRTD